METLNFLCLLSTNIIIEKIFVFLWFWFMFLTLSSLVNFLYYAMLLFSRNENIRNYFLAFAVSSRKKHLRWDDQKVGRSSDIQTHVICCLLRDHWKRKRKTREKSTKYIETYFY